MQSQTQSDTTVGWQNAATTPVRKDKEPSESDLRALDSIIPEVSQVIPSSQIRDSITVRPAMPSQNTAASCNDPMIGSYNHYHLSPNGIPSGI